jgi:hypothetical protein
MLNPGDTPIFIDAWYARLSRPLSDGFLALTTATLNVSNQPVQTVPLSELLTPRPVGKTLLVRQNLDVRINVPLSWADCRPENVDALVWIHLEGGIWMSEQ